MKGDFAYRLRVVVEANVEIAEVDSLLDPVLVRASPNKGRGDEIQVSQGFTHQ